MQPQWFRLLFLIASVGILIAEAIQNVPLRWVLKPLLMPLLMAYYWASIQERSRAVHRPVLAGLFFGWIGDVALMFVGQSQTWFIVGLVAFLIGHVLYIFAFQRTRKPAEPAILKQQKWLFLPFLAYTSGLLYILLPYAGALKIPVILYAVVICTMALTAVNRLNRVPMTSFMWVLGGALLFLVSDSVLAINKFVAPFTLAGLVIMLTYLMGQYGIAEGCLRQESRR